MASLFLVALQPPVSAAAAAAADEIPVGGGQAEHPPQRDPVVPEQAPDANEETESGAEAKVSVLDRHKRFMDTQIQRADQWVDGFFADPNYEADTVDSQFRLRPEFYYRDEQGAKLRMRTLIKVRLPNLGHKISLIAGSEEDEDHFGQTSNDSERNRIAGLQVFLKDTAKWNTSIIAGIRFGESALFFGPRFRYQTPLTERTSFRFVQTIRWQTNDRWDIGSSGDLNFLLSERFYFRQTVYTRWRDSRRDEEGLRTRISSVLSQRLSATAGLQYDFSTIIHTEPDTHVDKYVLSARYRKRTHRDWLFWEIVPEVAFEDQFDFKTNPGIHLRVEFDYGGSGPKQFWERGKQAAEQ